MKHLLICLGLCASVGHSIFADEPAVVTKPRKKAALVEGVDPESAKPVSKKTAPGVPLPLASTELRTTDPSPSAPLSPVSATGQKKWEALLAEPADLDFGERQTVSVKEIFEGLRERHHLSLRIDNPTLSALVGAEHVAITPKDIKQASKLSGSYASKPKRSLPVQLAGGPEQASSAVVQSTPDEAATPVSDPTESADEDDEKNDDDADVCESEDCEKESCEDEESQGKAEVSADEEELEFNLVANFLTLEVNIQTLDLKQATIATVLRQALDAMPITFGADFLEMPFPISLSNACLLDYLVENDGLVITTRMQALSHKETRVYSVKHLKELNPEELAKIIRQSIRPWSWRSQITDLGDQLKGSLQLPTEVVKSMVSTGIQLASAQTGATVTISEDEPAELDSKPETSDAEQLKAIGNATVNGLVTFAHATVLGLEMVHHADFPTGTILSLPGKLIVTQSQAAHREIADLLKQLAAE
jgi:hypothetical protein